MTPTGCLVAMYHYIRDTNGPSSGLNALSPDDFGRQLDRIAAERGIVACDELERALAARRRLDGAALLTFDDGFADHFETVFPVLESRGWTGVFFLVGEAHAERRRVANVHKTHLLLDRLGSEVFSEAVRESMPRHAVAAGIGVRWRQEVYRYDQTSNLEVKHLLNYELPFETTDRILDELFAREFGDQHDFASMFYLSGDRIAQMAAAGMVFGFHTEHHRVLSRLTPEEQRLELCDGVARVRALSGQASVPFCFPYGHPHTYDGHTLRVLAESGYSLGFTTTRRLANTGEDERFLIPRFDTRDLPPFVEDLPRS
ncbi:MAG: polysaccharide deacetylase family protein [Acidobacteriota bacterium]